MNSKKSYGVDLENKKPIFLEVGMILTLIVVILAFNWKSYDKQIIQNYERMAEDIPEEMVPITQQKPPQPPRVNPPPVITQISIVENDDQVLQDYFIDAEANPMDTMEFYVPPAPLVMQEEPAPAEEEIFEVVESMPAYPGGDNALYSFLGKNLKYPELARETGINGKVFLTFVVEKDGSITDVKILRGIGAGCDEEALRVVHMMPKWTPGKQRGIPVRVKYILSIRFTLQ